MKVDVYARFFFWATIPDKGRPNRCVPGGKLNDLRQLALFGAVAAANDETWCAPEKATQCEAGQYTNYTWDHFYWHSHKLRKLELGSTAIGTW